MPLTEAIKALGQPETTELDLEINKLANRDNVLTTSLAAAFCFGWACAKNWSEAAKLYNDAFGEEVKAATVRRYARAARKRLKDTEKDAAMKRKSGRNRDEKEEK